ncbi:hypothetical protein M426DRAFT_27806 [Hypoxylon sp. CI-4A]|nr:hypothetical protein M426DRAFT_27806 [Hypoxylon sp. CI-4A]
MSARTSKAFVGPDATLRALLPDEGFVWSDGLGASVMIVSPLNDLAGYFIQKGDMEEIIKRVFKTATEVTRENGVMALLDFWKEMDSRLGWKRQVSEKTFLSFMGQVTAARDTYGTHPPTGVTEVYDKGMTLPRSCFHGGIEVDEYVTEYNKQERSMRKRLELRGYFNVDDD